MLTTLKNLLPLLSRFLHRSALKLRHFCKKHPVLAYLSLFGLFFVIFIVLPHSVFAATDTTTEQKKQELYKSLQAGAATALDFISVIIWPVLTMIGALMDNSLIFGAGMEERLLAAWQPIRNFVNIAFVIILIVIAFYNVLGRTEGDFTLKQILPKFIIALIAINFSTLICKVILESVNVLTTSVASLNINLTEQYKYTAPINNPWVAYNLCMEDPKKIEEKKKGENTARLKEFCDKGWDQGPVPRNWKEAGTTYTPAPETYFSETGKTFFGAVDKANLPFILAATVIGNIDKISADLSKSKDITFDKLAVDMIFSVFILLVYGFSFTALFLVLIARLCMIWIVVILAPLAGLLYVLPQSVKGELGGEFDLTKQFLQHAMAPFVIITCLTIGNIMIDAFAIKAGGGSPLTSIKLSEISSSCLTNIGTIQELLIALCTIAIVWIGVFAAASKTMAKSFTDSIKSFGENTLKEAGKLVQFLPLPIGIDIGKEGKEGGTEWSRWTIGDIIHGPGQLISGVKEGLENKRQQRYQALSGGTPPTADKLLRQLEELQKAGKKPGLDPSQKIDIANQIVQTIHQHTNIKDGEWDNRITQKIADLYKPCEILGNSDVKGKFKDTTKQPELDAAKGDIKNFISRLNKSQIFSKNEAVAGGVKLKYPSNLNAPGTPPPALPYPTPTEAKELESNINTINGYSTVDPEEAGKELTKQLHSYIAVGKKPLAKIINSTLIKACGSDGIFSKAGASPTEITNALTFFNQTNLTDKSVAEGLNKLTTFFNTADGTDIPVPLTGTDLK